MRRDFKSLGLPSLSARRAWIEIPITGAAGLPLMSLSARRAWIEIYYLSFIQSSAVVALRKESVDRNIQSSAVIVKMSIKVALRKESVDRNLKRCQK